MKQATLKIRTMSHSTNTKTITKLLPVMKKTIFSLFISILFPTLAAQAQVKEWFGATPDLHVSGKNLVDPEGNAVTLHGVMDTPNTYFDKNFWSGGYETDQDVANCLAYFDKVMDAIHNPEKGTYCNLFRLHLDPAWTNDNNIIASGFTKKPDLDENGVQKNTAWGSPIWIYTDPTGQVVESEANICHFSMTRFKKYLEKLYIPIAKKALGHGMYVIMRPPGVFPHTVTVGDYYNQYLLSIWDVVSSDPYIKAHAGQISFELGNEPVAVNGSLADFFQPIINKIRSNGFTGVIWAPGSTWQQDYQSYKTKALNDSNLGYAVHFYPSWFKTIGNDSGSPLSNATVLNDFKTMVPVQATNPIVITEVDWSPEQSGAGHVNESGQYVTANFGTWGTGSTSVKGKFGEQFKYVVDQCGNISWNLQGTHTYVDFAAYMRDGTIQPAFTDQMKAMGFADASQACSGTCFKWFYEYACGDQLPHGEVNYETETPIGSAIGNAALNNGHYEFYTPSFSSFVFDQFKGTPLTKCAEFTINLGEGSTIGYRLDVQLKDADGNIIKYIDQNGAEQSYIIGTENNGTRFTSPESKTFDFQTIFAEYLEQYPGCTVGEIRLNTVVDWGKEDSDKTGKYWFTIDKMEMNKSEITARAGSKGTSLADVKMYKHEGQVNYVYNNPTTLGGWINGDTQGTFTNNNDGSYKFVVTKAGNPWNAQFNIGDNTYTDGTEYTLQLDIKGSVAGSIGAAIQKSEGYDGRGNFPSIPVTTSWQTVTVKATVSGEGADRILLNYGAYVGTLDIKNIKVSYVGDKATELSDSHVKFGEVLAAGEEAFSAYFNGNVDWDCYSDLSAYSKMIIKGTGGSLRILYNRPVNNGTCPELSASLASGEAVVDLTTYPYFHLNSIKVNWGNTANINSITLISGNGNNAEIADYYISGAGHITDAAQAALDDVKATVIDATGLTNINPWSLSTANPNCLIIYKEDNNVGSAFDERNLVKQNAWGYDTYSIKLVDDFDFRAPFAFNTVGSATYTRDLQTEWATIALPFELNVAVAGSPEIYQLTAVDAEKMVFTKVESGTIAAGSIILYHNADLGETKLYGNNIAQTVEGFNIQPLAGVDGWFTAQSFTSKTVEDVTKDPVLKDYEVYGVQADKFVHATKKINLKPFRAFFLMKKGSAAAKASYLIATDEEATGISSTPEIQAPAAYYDISGRRINSMKSGGITIIRKADGSVRKVVK